MGVESCTGFLGESLEWNSGTIGFEDEPEAEGKGRLRRSRRGTILVVGRDFYGQEKECRDGGPTDR